MLSIGSKFAEESVGALVPDYDQVQKITIIPRSNGAGGLTFFAPQESRLESGLYSRQYLESNLAVALGGRLAEEIIYGEDMATTGASSDIQQVANIAKRMVKQWGMSDKVGRVVVQEQGYTKTWGAGINDNCNGEVERLVNNAYLVAKTVLESNRDLLERLKEVLVEQEVVSAEEFQMLLVEFNAQTVGYEVLGAERNREKLPFQALPTML